MVEELDEDLAKQDEDSRRALQKVTSLAGDLGGQLLSLKAASSASDNVRDALMEVETRKEADPSMDYSACFPDITKQLENLTETLRASTFDMDHPLRRDAKDYQSRLYGLKAHAPDAARPIVVETKTTRDPFEFPKAHIPKFKGELEQWHPFWSRFKTAVHENPRIEEPMKLVMLTDLITEDSLHDYIIAHNDGEPNRYQEIIEHLKHRFHRPRELHSVYCRRLADLNPIKGTASELSEAADTVFAAVQGIKRGGQGSIDHLATSLVASILPKQLRHEWETNTEMEEEVPDIKTWLAFVRKKAIQAGQQQKSTSNSAPPVKSTPRKTDRGPTRSEGRVHVATSKPSASEDHQGSSRRKQGNNSSKKVQCQLCNSNHFAFQCTKFLDMSVSQRKAHAQTFSLCPNCLRPGHVLSDCQCSYKCRVCKRQHNTLLHSEDSVSTALVHRVSPSPASPPPQEDPTGKLIMTSLVRVTSPKGKSMVVRAMLDSAAEVQVLSTRVMQELKLPKRDEWLVLTGVEEQGGVTPRPTVQFTVSSLTDNNWSMTITAAVKPQVTADSPRRHLKDVKELPHLQGLDFADPHYHEPRRVDLLLDVGVLDSVLLPERKKGPPNTPTAWNTKLGWGVMGMYPINPIVCSNTAAVNVLQQQTEAKQLNLMLERFWLIEDMIQPRSFTFTAMEAAVQQHYKDTHKFSTPHGRYVVTLPRKATDLQLGDSRRTAISRYVRNEQSLSRKGQLEQFNTILQGYLSQGHAQQVTTQEMEMPTQQTYYLPMHSVFKQSSTSTKMRIVFDASCPSSSGASLNDLLAVGPTLHPNLDRILIRFRSYRVALSGDIKQMYREVLLSPQDRQQHRFVWRPSPSEPLADYCMNRVTFGVSASPYAAVRTLQQTVEDFSTPESDVSWHIKNSFYVDDLLAGADTVNAAIKLQQDIRTTLLKAGFDIRKWRSSSAVVLDSIPQELQETLPIQELVDHHSSTYSKTLGIGWDQLVDEFLTHVKLPPDYISTKRGIVSDTARLYDVLGWLSPFIIRMKLLFQQLWKEKMDWDTTLEQKFVTLHQQWRLELTSLGHISIPRCYFTLMASTSTQLHGFSDASETAYASAVYIRSTYPDGNAVVRIVVAKTKVAPLNQVTLTRLELCAAEMLSELLKTVMESLEIPSKDVFAWCDNTTVIAWLRSPPSNFKTFVANRIASASRNISISSWRYTPSEDNSADCATRGLTADELKNHELWWKAPPWLNVNPITIPFQPNAGHSHEEEKPLAAYSIVATTVSWWEKKAKSYITLLHSTAYIFRFIGNCRAALKRGPVGRDRTLTMEEVKRAEAFLFKQSQARTFGTEVVGLAAKPPKPIMKSSRLRLVHPYLNPEGILLVGGRLKNTSLPPHQKHPPILSASDVVTKLLFAHYHVSLSHCGPTLLLAHTAHLVYVVGAKKLATSVCHACLLCRRRAPRALGQQMGQLPSYRVNQALTFQHTGIDYAGPFYYKRGNPRRPTYVKGYLALMVCLATKAVHIEVVSSQATEDLVAALKRFISRKGLPQHVYSDHGTNFVGARHDLHDLYVFLSQPDTDAALKDWFLSNSITWHHIPERAPHFGGIWESVVKSTKHHLKRIVGQHKLTFEEMTTVTCCIEACLNSRPYLAQDSHNSEGELPLTPGHFLIGRPLHAYPEEPVEPDATLQDRWKLCQSITQAFWNAWSGSYLKSLQKLSKWHKPQRNLIPGDLVMVLESSSLMTRWRLGKVTAVFPGEDNLVRTAEITTTTTVFPDYWQKTSRKLNLKDLKVKVSTFKRPVTKLALLMAASSSLSNCR